MNRTCTGGAFYVYDLVDPRNGQTFYVGKGTGGRCRQHIADAKKGKTGPKYDLIREILAEGLEVGVCIIREFEDEARAYASEKRRIAKLGRCTLKNIAAGGGGVRRVPCDDGRKASREEVIALLTRVVAQPEPKHGLWAAAIHRAAVRALPRIIENNS